MKISNRLLSRWLHYSVDMTFLLIMTVWAFAPYKENQYLQVFALMVIGGFLYELLLPRISATVGKILLALPVLIGIGWLLEIDMFILLVTTAFVGWRFTSHYFDEDLGQEANMLLFSIVSGLLFLFLYANNEAVPIVLGLLFLQTILFTLTRVNRYIQSNPNTVVNNWITRFALLTIGGTILIAAFFPFIKSAAMFILKSFAAAFAVIFYYPFSFVFGAFERLLSEKEIDREDAEDVETSLEQNEELKKLVYENNQNDWFTYMLVILIIAGLIWYGIKLYKRRMMKLDRFAFDGMHEKSVIFEEDVPKNYFGGKVKGPDNKIRKQLFRLEKKMTTYESGRRSNEAVLEWLDRVDAPDELSAEINRIYQRVRYGEQNVTSEEEGRYVQSIDQLLKWTKAQYKMRKKEKKKKDRLDF